MALQALLVSPEFLFRIERDPAGVAANTAYRLNDVELASRLSFFLWSSIPDDQLLDLAIAGKLKDPATLERQVKRMIADPRWPWRAAAALGGGTRRPRAAPLDLAGWLGRAQAGPAQRIH